MMEDEDERRLGATLVLQTQYRRWSATRNVSRLRQKKSDAVFECKLTKLRERLEVRSAELQHMHGLLLLATLEHAMILIIGQVGCREFVALHVARVCRTRERFQ